MDFKNITLEKLMELLQMSEVMTKIDSFIERDLTEKEIVLLVEILANLTSEGRIILIDLLNDINKKNT